MRKTYVCNFSEVGALLRQLQCNDARYYDFLGPDAKKAMVSTFNLLYPNHVVKPGTRDSKSNAKAVTRFEQRPGTP
jgi:hypothetical protein